MYSFHEKGTKFIFNEDRGDGAKGTVASDRGGRHVMLVVIGIVDGHIICGKMLRVGIPWVNRGHGDLENGGDAVEFMVGGLSGMEEGNGTHAL